MHDITQIPADNIIILYSNASYHLLIATFSFIMDVHKAFVSLPGGLYLPNSFLHGVVTSQTPLQRSGCFEHAWCMNIRVCGWIF